MKQPPVVHGAGQINNDNRHCNTLIGSRDPLNQPFKPDWKRSEPFFLLSLSHTRNFLTFANTAAIASGQEIARSLNILVACNSSRVCKRQKITSSVTSAGYTRLPLRTMIAVLPEPYLTVLVLVQQEHCPELGNLGSENALRSCGMASEPVTRSPNIWNFFAHTVLGLVLLLYMISSLEAQG